MTRHQQIIDYLTSTGLPQTDAQCELLFETIDKHLINLATDGILFNDIVKVVSNVTGIPVDRMQDKGRHKVRAEARHMVCYLARTRTNKTLVFIGNFFNRDHTTIIHSIDRVKDLLYINDPSITKTLSLIEDRLQTGNHNVSGK